MTYLPWWNINQGGYMFPLIFASLMVGSIILMIFSFIKEEIEANIVHRVLATYLKKFKRRTKAM